MSLRRSAATEAISILAPGKRPIFLGAASRLVSGRKWASLVGWALAHAVLSSQRASNHNRHARKNTNRNNLALNWLCFFKSSIVNRSTCHSCEGTSPLRRQGQESRDSVSIGFVFHKSSQAQNVIKPCFQYAYINIPFQILALFYQIHERNTHDAERNTNKIGFVFSN